MTENDKLTNEMEMVRRLGEIPQIIRSIPKIQRAEENSQRFVWGAPWIPWKIWKTEQLREQIKKEYEGRINNDLTNY
jgi:hypothetical protein